MGLKELGKRFKDAVDDIKEGIGNVTRDVIETLEDVADEIGETIAESDLGRLIDAGKVAGDRLSVRTFPTSDPAFRYPEARNRRLRDKWDFGVAFSGGGTRSASLSLGQMRALRIMGLDDKIRYIGCISGGAWFAVPYTYLPGGRVASAVRDDDWLGQHQDPSQLRWSSVQRSRASDGIFARQVATSELYFLALGHIQRVLFSRLPSVRIPVLDIELGFDDYDEIYGRIVEDLFLNDVGLDGERYAGWTQTGDVDAVIRRHEGQIRLTNPNLDRSDFVWVDKDRPFVIANGAVNEDFTLEPDEKYRYDILQLTKQLRFHHYEFTPLYHGAHYHDTGRLNLNVGGGYTENVGFDTWLPVPKPNNTFTVSPGIASHRLTLKDIMGTSGAAPAYALHATESITSPLNIFPKYRMWPVEFTGKPVTVERPFGDGGYVDNYGIIPLLKRRVSSMIVFMNTNAKIEADASWPDGVKLDSFLPVLFGKPVPKDVAGDLKSPSVFLGKKGQVFDGVGYAQTVDGLLRTRELANMDADAVAGLSGSEAEKYDGLVRGPIYHVGTYRTVRNDFFGVPGGDTVRVLWVYNQESEAWTERLPRRVQTALKQESVLESFPRVGTFMGGKDPDLEPFSERIEDEMRTRGAVPGFFQAVEDTIGNAEFIDLHPEQVNLMANLSAWALLQLRPVIEEELLADEFRQRRSGTTVSLREVLRAANTASSLDHAFDNARRRGGGFSPTQGRSLRDLADRLVD